MKAKVAVILAAGEGQRLDRLNNPKPLVRVGSKPLIIHNIQQLQESGVETIYVVIGHRADEIKKELTGNAHVQATIHFIEQEDGARNAMLASLFSLVGVVNEPFYLTMSDLVIEQNPYKLFHSIDTYDPRAIYSLVGVEKKQFDRAGALSRVCIDGQCIVELGEEIEPYDGLEVGVYGITPATLKEIKKHSEEQGLETLSDLLIHYAKKGRVFPVQLKKGEWFDVNTPAVHVRADMFLRNTDQVQTIPENRRNMSAVKRFSHFYRDKKMSTDIIVERNLVKRIHELKIIPEYAASSPHFIITDSRVDKHYGDLVLNGFLQAGYNVKKFVISEGESSKNISEFTRLADEIFSYGMDKHSIIISLGGGVVNNIAGVLASTLYRGIDLIHIATSSMSQVDAALDFKQAINSTAGKNLIGSYYPASKIIIDPEVLKTLDARHVRNGLAESIKHGLTQDKKFVDFMYQNADRVGDTGFLEKVIRKTIELKVPLLSGDVKEDVNEMLPQYGHSVGHAVEHLSSYELLHGEAVAVGMCVSAEVAQLLGFCDERVADFHYKILERYNLPTVVPDSITAEDIINTIRYDKHHHGGVPHMALPDGIGSAWNDKNVYSVPVSYEILIQAINNNKKRT